MVTRTKGTRQGTRSILRKDKRERRRLFISRSMHTYQEGDKVAIVLDGAQQKVCLLYTSPSPRDQRGSRMPSSA